MHQYNKNSLIAFFDSGLGGLSVLKTALKILPNEKYFYYADTEHAPYGTKTKREIIKYTLAAIKFLSKQNVKVLVLACNTATSAAINTLRKNFEFKIIGMEPAIKPALEKNTKKKILVLATTLTLHEKKLSKLIKKLSGENKVAKLSLDKLVAYAEKFQFNNQLVKKYITEQLSSIKIKEYETIVLGCTHFVFYKPLIKKIIPSGINIIDGNAGTVKNMHNFLKKNNLLNPSNKHDQISFYSSNNPETKIRIKKFKKLLK